MNNKLREIRKDRGMDLRTLGRATGINYVALARLEKNEAWNPTLSTLRRLASFLEVSVGALIGEESMMLPNRRKDGGQKMKSAEDREAQKKLNQAVKEAKEALEGWRNKYIKKGMRDLVWGFDYQEIDLIIRLLKLKLENQTATI